MRFAIIEDNDAAGDSLKMLLEEIYVDPDIRVFENIFDAKDWPADYAIIDVSAVSPIGWGQYSYATICSYMELHPGTKVLIISGLPESHFKSIVDEVRAELPDVWIEHRSMLDVTDWIDELR